MLLPSTKDVQKERTEERRNLIDEGIKIARKIDSLRDTLGKEERALKQFRDNSMSIVLKEIRVLQDERDSLKAQVKGLKKLKNTLQADITNQL